MRSSLLWNAKQRRLIVTDVSGLHIGPIGKGQGAKGDERLSRNMASKLPLYTASTIRKSEVSLTLRRKPENMRWCEVLKYKDHCWHTGVDRTVNIKMDHAPGTKACTGPSTVTMQLWIRFDVSVRYQVLHKNKMSGRAACVGDERTAYSFGMGTT
jgi:hypothetical protein